MMKTIKVEDEVYDKLIALATEMTTQDPRCTTGPHLFQIQTKKEVAAYEGQGVGKWFTDDWDEIIDIDQYLIDYADLDIGLRDMEDEDKEEALENLGCSQVFIDEIDVYQNCFFTSKACQEHIDSNSYHYNNPVNYLNSGWRNPEMELVQEFLCGLVGKKMHR